MCVYLEVKKGKDLLLCACFQLRKQRDKGISNPTKGCNIKHLVFYMHYHPTHEEDHQLINLDTVNHTIKLSYLERKRPTLFMRIFNNFLFPIGSSSHTNYNIQYNNDNHTTQRKRNNTSHHWIYMKRRYKKRKEFRTEGANYITEREREKKRGLCINITQMNKSKVRVLLQTQKVNQVLGLRKRIWWTPKGLNWLKLRPRKAPMCVFWFVLGSFTTTLNFLGFLFFSFLDKFKLALED